LLPAWAAPCQGKRRRIIISATALSFVPGWQGKCNPYSRETYACSSERAQALFRILGIQRAEPDVWPNQFRLHFDDGAQLGDSAVTVTAASQQIAGELEV